MKQVLLETLLTSTLEDDIQEEIQDVFAYEIPIISIIH